MIILRIIFGLLLFNTQVAQVFAEEMTVKKITLGRFEIKNDVVLELVKNSPYWPQVDRHILTVDDRGQIYVLNRWHNEILVFEGTGKLYKRIAFPIDNNKPLKFEPLDDKGFLEVSGDGNKLFIITNKEFILDRNGKILKQSSLQESLISATDIRLCNSRYVSLQAPYYYDENFSLIGGLGDNKERLSNLYKLSHADSKGNYYIIEKRSLIKYTKEDKKLWEKVFDNSFRILGLDGIDDLYLTGILKKGDPGSLYKLDSKGNILSKAAIPDPFPLITQEEKQEWEVRPSEEFLSFFKLACNGDVYLIYQLGELPKLTFQRWLKGGEYFIYKFETKK